MKFLNLLLHYYDSILDLDSADAGLFTDGVCRLVTYLRLVNMSRG